MQYYHDYERQLRALQQKEEKISAEVIHCPKCHSQWFEQIECGKYMANHNVIFGQKIPLKPNTMSYVLLRCVRCQELLEPKISTNPRDLAASAYGNLIDTLEGHGDRRTESSPSQPMDKKDNIFEEI